MYTTTAAELIDCIVPCLLLLLFKDALLLSTQILYRKVTIQIVVIVDTTYVKWSVS